MRGSIVERRVKAGRLYYVVLAFGSKRKWVPAGRRRIDAEEVLAVELGKARKGPFKENKRLTFKAFALRWLDEYAKGKVKESTYADYEGSVRVHLIPAFGDLPLCRITLEDIQRFVNSKLHDGQLSPKRINNILVPLKEMFKHAVRWNYLDENPALYVEKPRIIRQEMDFLTPEEIKLFLNAVEPRYQALFHMACLTGLRRGELLACKWSNLDLTRRQYFVKESLYRDKFVEPKSALSKRAVNLSPTLIRILEKHKVEQDKQILKLGAEYQRLDLIFCQDNGKPLDANNMVKRVFIPALKRAQLRRIRFHDLRHSYASLLIDQGENPKYIQNQLGHSSIQITMDRYGHLMPEKNTAAGEKLDKAIFGAA